MNPGFYRIVLYKTLAFFVAWVLLSDSYNVFHLALGLAVSFGVALLNTPDTQSPFLSLRWSRMVFYAPWLLGRILQSGIHLSALILHPRLPIDPKFLRYQTKFRNEAGLVLLGNSITLTPGTITADVNSHELTVHAMDDKSAHDLTSHKMEDKIASVFGLGERQR